MPPYLPAPDDATSTTSSADRHAQGGGPASQQPPTPKQNQTLLSLLLKPLIVMRTITTLFFLFLGFATLVLLHLCLAGGLLHGRRTTLHQLPPPASPTPALSSRDLRRLPRFKHLRNDTSSSCDQNPICTVCFDDFRRGQWCRELPGCGHLFHRGCVDPWVVKVAACRVCRTQVRADPDCSSSCTGNRGGRYQFWSFTVSSCLGRAFCSRVVVRSFKFVSGLFSSGSASLVLGIISCKCIVAINGYFLRIVLIISTEWRGKTGQLCFEGPRATGVIPGAQSFRNNSPNARANSPDQ